MTTFERTTKETPKTNGRVPARVRPQRSSTTLMAMLAAFALVAGLVGGYFLRGTDSVDDVVLVGGGQMTDRQEEIVALFEDYTDAWLQGDGEAVAAMFVDNGTATILGTTYRIDDGTLAGYVDRDPVPDLDIMEPSIMHDNTLVDFHEVPMGEYINIMRFTATGDVQIVSHVITS